MHSLRPRSLITFFAKILTMQQNIPDNTIFCPGKPSSPTFSSTMLSSSPTAQDTSSPILLHPTKAPNYFPTTLSVASPFPFSSTADPSASKNQPQMTNPSERLPTQQPSLSPSKRISSPIFSPPSPGTTPTMPPAMIPAPSAPTK